MKNNKGFSLVELIVVIAIMAILAAVAIPTFATFIKRANVASDLDFMNSVEYAADLACAGEALKVTGIKVVLSEEKGTAASVEVEIEGKDDAVVVERTNSGEDAEFKNLIAGTIDWDYKFKSTNSELSANEKWKDEWSLGASANNSEDDDENPEGGADQGAEQ